MYNARNSLQEEKVKEKLGEDAETALATVSEGISWLDEHQDDEKEVYEEKQKEVEEKVRPTLMKLYQGAADEFSAAKGADTAATPAPGPKIEEVD